MRLISGMVKLFIARHFVFKRNIKKCIDQFLPLGKKISFTAEKLILQKFSNPNQSKNRNRP